MKRLLLLFSLSASLSLSAQKPTAASLQRDLDSLALREASLRAALQQVRAEREQAEKERARGAETLGQLRQEAAQLELFEREARRQDALSLRAYLALPLSQLSADTLQWMASALEGYDDAEAQEALRHVETIATYRQEAARAQAVINAPLNVRDKDAARQWCRGMKGKQYLSEAQWLEIDTLDINLSLYIGAQYHFAQTIRDLRARLETLSREGADAEERAQAVAAEVLAAHREELDKRVPYIPYLQRRYARYLELLSADVLASNQEREDIEEEILTAKTQ